MLILTADATVEQAAIQPSIGVSLGVSPEISARSPNGVEIIRAVVSPDGAIATCKASIVGRGPVSDKENCRKLMKFKIAPAVDQQGHQTYGTAEVRLAWSVSRPGNNTRAPGVVRATEPDLYLPLSHLPDGVPSDATSTLILVTGSDGKVETCKIGQTSGATILDDAACRAVTLAGVAPLQDKSGASVRGIQTVKVGFAVKP